MKRAEAIFSEEGGLLICCRADNDCLQPVRGGLAPIELAIFH
jgi:hypothetical protein